MSRKKTIKPVLELETFGIGKFFKPEHLSQLSQREFFSIGYENRILKYHFTDKCFCDDGNVNGEGTQFEFVNVQDPCEAGFENCKIRMIGLGFEKEIYVSVFPDGEVGVTNEKNSTTFVKHVIGSVSSVGFGCNYDNLFLCINSGKLSTRRIFCPLKIIKVENPFKKFLVKYKLYPKLGKDEFKFIARSKGSVIPVELESKNSRELELELFLFKSDEGKAIMTNTKLTPVSFQCPNPNDPYYCIPNFIPLSETCRGHVENWFNVEISSELTMKDSQKWYFVKVEGDVSEEAVMEEEEDE